MAWFPFCQIVEEVPCGLGKGRLECFLLPANREPLGPPVCNVAPQALPFSFGLALLGCDEVGAEDRRGVRRAKPQPGFSEAVGTFISWYAFMARGKSDSEAATFVVGEPVSNKGVDADDSHLARLDVEVEEHISCGFVVDDDSDVTVSSARGDVFKRGFDGTHFRVERGGSWAPSVVVIPGIGFENCKGVGCLMVAVVISAVSIYNGTVRRLVHLMDLFLQVLYPCLEGLGAFFWRRSVDDDAA